MSGDLLRRCAVFGDVDGIKNLLEQGANPCSTDVRGFLKIVRVIGSNHTSSTRAGKSAENPRGWSVFFGPVSS